MAGKGLEINQLLQKQCGQDRHYFSLTSLFLTHLDVPVPWPRHLLLCPLLSLHLQQPAGVTMTISKWPVASKFCKIHILCCSLWNTVYVFIITTTKPLQRGKCTEQKAAILTVRVHPGETKNSWITKGFMDFILVDSSKVQLLQDSFVLKAVHWIQMIWLWEITTAF